MSVDTARNAWALAGARLIRELNAGPTPERASELVEEYNDAECAYVAELLGVAAVDGDGLELASEEWEASAPFRAECVRAGGAAVLAKWMTAEKKTDGGGELN